MRIAIPTDGQASIKEFTDLDISVVQEDLSNVKQHKLDKILGIESTLWYAREILFTEYFKELRIYSINDFPVNAMIHHCMNSPRMRHLFKGYLEILEIENGVFLESRNDDARLSGKGFGDSS